MMNKGITMELHGIAKEKNIINKRVTLFQNMRKDRFDVVQKKFSFM